MRRRASLQLLRPMRLSLSGAMFLLVVSAPALNARGISFFRGSTWSMSLAGVKFSNPLAFVEASLASGTLVTPVLVSALVPLALTLVLGRFFCGWLCPAGFLFEEVKKLRRFFPTAALQLPRNPMNVVLLFSLLLTLLLSGGVISLFS